MCCCLGWRLAQEHKNCIVSNLCFPIEVYVFVCLCGEIYMFLCGHKYFYNYAKKSCYLYYVLYTLAYCLSVYPTALHSLFPLYMSLWSTRSHCFSCFLPVIWQVCVYVCLWWTGRKSPIKWGHSSNVGRDWDQETNLSALCKFFQIRL